MFVRCRGDLEDRDHRYIQQMYIHSQNTGLLGNRDDWNMGSELKKKKNTGLDGKPHKKKFFLNITFKYKQTFYCIPIHKSDFYQTAFSVVKSHIVDCIFCVKYLWLK